ncbi:MAG: hypothetical protein M3R06_06630 [Chloroflexota bacterium]|nr:hypothetical protein [Chloroflexota bacterium]
MLARDPSALAVGKIPSVKAIQEDDANTIFRQAVLPAVPACEIAITIERVRDLSIRESGRRKFERANQAVCRSDRFARRNRAVNRISRKNRYASIVNGHSEW